MKRQVKRLIVSAVALSLLVPAISAPETQAASKPKLSKKSVSVKVGKTKKITVKGVKAKKIKKTTWSVKSKKIAALSKKKKNSVTIKGKKAGKTTLTAKIKVGKKTYKKTCKIQVSKASVIPASNGNDANKTPTAKPTATATATATAPSTAGTPTPTPTAVPTLRALTTDYKNATAPQQQSADVFPTTPPSPQVDPSTAVGYDVDFEDVEVGIRTQDAIEGEGIKGAVLRGCEGDTANDYLEVVDGSTVLDENDAATNTTNVLHCYRAVKTWQGPMFNLTEYLDEGCTYTLEADVFSLTADLWASYQLQTTEDTAVGYGQLTGDSQSNPRIAAGEWKHVSYTVSIPDDKYYYALYFESYNGQKLDDIYLDNIKLTKTKANNRDTSIASLKETYQDVFDIVGVGAGTDSLFGESASEFIASQYNAYTPGNEMKPDAILSSSMTALTLEEAKEKGYYIPDDYASYSENRNKAGQGDVVVPELNFANVDQILQVCHEKGLKLRGHTLCWHEQTPAFFFTQNFRVAIGSKDKTTGDYKYQASKEVMDSRQEFFVKTVLNYVLKKDLELAGGDKSKCVVYGYDAVNEYLHSSTADSNTKPTYWGTIYDTTVDNGYMAKTGVTYYPSYVKDTFKWAHEVLVENDRTDVKLFYNDYNCYQYPEDIVHLVDYINSDGKICDGIGMQAHLDISQSFHSADNFAKALACFQENAPEVEVQITELDATMESTADNVKTDEDQAAYYDQIMGTILQNKKNGGNITGITIWSLYDGVSWRSGKYPCIFSGLYAPKSAFYAVIGAKATYWD